MRRIKLLYWNEEKNLGDQLSPYIVHKLTGLPITHKNGALSFKEELLLIPQLFFRKISFQQFSHVPLFYEKVLLAIGSILSWGNKRSIVWGSGFMYENETFRGGKVYAVRGKLSNDRLIELGFKGCNVWGDPALLLPLFVAPTKEKTVDIAIIPHYSEYEYFKEEYGEKYKIIDIRTNDVEEFVKELTSCKHILSTSLHGIILAHAYHIPALWIQNKNKQIGGFKFYDYFSSVDIPYYEGCKDVEKLLHNNNWFEIFTQNQNLCLPHKDIGIIQNALMKAMPFSQKKCENHSLKRKFLVFCC